MKTKLFIFSLFASLSINLLNAQDRTTVTASTDEISDNLDLRAVASIFGDSDNLQDFERRLNDPKLKISNLDLNGDNQVDYLRVVESVEQTTHLIIIQSVIGNDNFQDVATVEVEKDRNNNIQVQVVGDVFMYGSNYIYEPVYFRQPLIYNTFWVHNYTPYYSSWYYGYYPTYYYAWAPYPVHYYWTNVNHCINSHHHYNYVNIRRSHRAIALHRARRSNAYETQYPTRAFAYRNTSVANSHELGGIRNNNVGTPRSEFASTQSQITTPKGGVRAENNPVRPKAGVTNIQGVIPTTEISGNSVQHVPPRGEFNTPKGHVSNYNDTVTPRNEVIQNTTPKPVNVGQTDEIRNAYSTQPAVRPRANQANTIRQLEASNYQAAPNRPSIRSNSSINRGISHSMPMNNSPRGRR